MQVTSACIALNLSGSSEIFPHLPTWYSGVNMLSACRFHAFSGREVLQNLALQPEFSENICRCRDHSAAGSTDAKRFDQATGGKLSGPGSLTFSAFLGWGILSETAHHSDFQDFVTVLLDWLPQGSARLQHVTDRHLVHQVRVQPAKHLSALATMHAPRWALPCFLSER